MSGVYAISKQALVTGAFNWTTGSFALMLVGPGYTPNFETDTTLASIPAGSQLLGAPLALAGETAANGYCQATNASWPSLTTTAALMGLAILQNVAGTYNLVAYIDQGTGFGQIATAIPANIVWDSRGIFRP